MSKIINGYFVDDTNDKEELLDLLINIRSYRGLGCQYKELKKKSCEELIEEINKVGNDFNGVVTIFDVGQNCNTFTCKISQNKRVVEMGNGMHLIIETLDEFEVNCDERLAEGNKLSEQELKIIKRINSKEYKEVNSEV